MTKEERRREYVRAYNKKYRLNNKEKIRELHSKYREKNREKIRRNSREYYRKNNILESTREYREKYYRENKEMIIKKQKEYRSKPEIKKRRKEYIRNYQTSDNAREKHKIYMREAYKDPINKKKSNARSKISDHIRRGLIKKETNCSLCKSTNNIEKHHPDYNKPLEVIWLCRDCHVELHKDLKRDV